jgi:ubiquinone/menaquinone biosynthesis C-methylase UbiE
MLDAPVRKKSAHFNTDSLNAGEALNQAHFLAFAPYAFQAAVVLRDRGILAMLEAAGDAGMSLPRIAAAAHLSDNSAHVLLEAGLGIGMLYDDSGRFYITKTGHFFLNNDTVRTNTNFMRDVCAPGMAQLEQSLDEARPSGLQALGAWDTIFEGLDQLPQAARDSWYALNNHHSDSAFRDALPVLFTHSPKRILDIGGSTGRFALACLDWDDSVHVGVADICVNAEQAEPGIASAVNAGRVTLHPMNVLDVAPALPEGYDTIWMSQFLPCFSEAQIAEIMAKCYAVLPADGRIYIMETFWDRQRFAAAAAALQLTSLYFVNIATGISRMWSSEQLTEMIEAAGFEVAAQKNSIGRGHTLMELRKA